ncbi:hypothetical protein NNRS527_00283 [Nitrosospira sp. NRS527]|nr:hypothetical protein NNRS527_00283 [Nitrosospira sp. NRS527]
MPQVGRAVGRGRVGLTKKVRFMSTKTLPGDGVELINELKNERSTAGCRFKPLVQTQYAVFVITLEPSFIISFTGMGKSTPP